MARRPILDRLIQATEKDVCTCKSVNPDSAKSLQFAQQLEKLREIKRGMSGPLIFKVDDMKRDFDAKNLKVLHERWTEIEESEKRAQDLKKLQESERLKKVEKQNLRRARETDLLLEKTRQEFMASSRAAQGLEPDPGPAKQASKSKYVPKPQSGGFAVLVALHLLETAAPKDTVMEKGKWYSQTPFKTPGKQYSAWSSVSKLVSEGYVYKSMCTRIKKMLYGLTPSGASVAKDLMPIVRQLGLGPPGVDLQADLAQDRASASTKRALGGSHSSSSSAKKKKTTEIVCLDEGEIDLDTPSVPLTVGAAAAAAAISRNSNLRASVTSAAVTGGPGSMGLPDSAFSTKAMNAAAMASLNAASSNRESPSSSTSSSSSTTATSSASSYSISARGSNIGLTATRTSPLAAPFRSASTSSSRSSSTSLNQAASQVTTLWTPGQYEVLLLIDKREMKQEEFAHCMATLELRGVKKREEVLQVGDFLYAARHKETKATCVLNIVIERKREDDLSSSISDSRYEEQKFRLKKCGVENVVYIVEKFNGEYIGKDRAMGSIYGRLMTIDDCLLKKTKSMADTVDYLSSLYNATVSYFADVTLEVGQDMGGLDDSGRVFRTMGLVPWQNKSLKSNHSLKVLFIQMLMTMSGISAEKATTIQELFPTPKHLMDKYNEMEVESDKKKLLEVMTKGRLKNIGPKASELVYEVFGTV